MDQRLYFHNHQCIQSGTKRTPPELRRRFLHWEGIFVLSVQSGTVQLDTGPVFDYNNRALGPQ